MEMCSKNRKVNISCLVLFNLLLASCWAYLFKFIKTKQHQKKNGFRTFCSNPPRYENTKSHSPLLCNACTTAVCVTIWAFLHHELMAGLDGYTGCTWIRNNSLLISISQKSSKLTNKATTVQHLRVQLASCACQVYLHYYVGYRYRTH